MNVSRPSTRLRSFAASVGGLAIAGLLTLSGAVGGGTELTEAAWNDTEVAKASIETRWPTAFASVVAGSVKSADAAVNNDGMTYQSVFRWTTQLDKPPISPTRETTTSKPGFTRTWDQRYQGLGEAVRDGASNPNPLGDVDPASNSLHNWGAIKEFSNPGLFGPFRMPPRNYRCLSISPTLSEQANCGQSNSFAAASNTTDAFGFSIASSNAYITFLNAANLSTSVKCGMNSAEAHPPTGRIDIGTEQGASNPYLSYGTFSNRVRTIWASGQPPHPNGFTSISLPDRQISEAWNVGALGGNPYVRVMPIVTKHASDSNGQPYAISEIAAYVEIFDTNLILPSELRAKMYFVLSRSECGVRRIVDPSLPAQRGVFPSSLPGGNGLTPYNPAIHPAPALLQAMPESVDKYEVNALAAELLPTTTLTSPLENSTASETTTSAPPNPSGEDASTTAGTTTAATTSTTRRTTTVTSQAPTVTASPTSTTTPPATKTVTTTSAAPAVVIPDEPGTLSPTARLEDVGTVTVDVNSEDFVVVAQGTTVPTDAQQGVAALEIWLNGGDPGDTWAMFTSTDPDVDGWRWAAVNQETGTVIYIR